jgi:hypothetical protein
LIYGNIFRILDFFALGIEIVFMFNESTVFFEKDTLPSPKLLLARVRQITGLTGMRLVEPDAESRDNVMM